MQHKQLRTPCTINSFRLGGLLLEARAKGTVTTVQTKHHSELGYIVVPEIGGCLGMGGYVNPSSIYSTYPGVFKRDSNTLVVLGTYGVSDLLSATFISPVLAHEHVEALTGNHFKGVIAEVEEARARGTLEVQNGLTRVRNFGLPITTLYDILTGKRYFKDQIKIRGILMNPVLFRTFLEACQHPDAKKDLELLKDELMNVTPYLTFSQLRRLGYGRYLRSKDSLPLSTISGNFDNQ
ncbi:MAG: hypothetical protein Q7S22_06955 [Candidatus Micrarchaeota archaeon]|nr:hypothetical protein [Candidatus Micrarchaeota archaeon]